MSVLKNKRSVSSLEFYHNAIMLRREITMLLLRDFGIKDKVRSVKSLYGVPGMEPEDEQKFRKLMDAGEMSFDDVRCAYASWKGGVSHYDSYNVVKSMDKLFDELFIHPFIEGGHRDEQNKNEQK